MTEKSTVRCIQKRPGVCYRSDGNSKRKFPIKGSTLKLAEGEQGRKPFRMDKSDKPVRQAGRKAEWRESVYSLRGGARGEPSSVASAAALEPTKAILCALTRFWLRTGRGYADYDERGIAVSIEHAYGEHYVRHGVAADGSRFGITAREDFSAAGKVPPFRGP